MRLTVLGTSSARPTIHRNVSGTVLEMDGESILFDCGEGTQRQALLAGLRFSRLQSIAITHLHGDHVNGLFGLLGTLVLDGRTRPIRVVGPPGLRRLIDVGQSLRLFSPRYGIEIEEFAGPDTVIRGNGYTVLCQPLDHSIETLGYALVEADRPGRFNVKRAIDLGIPPGPLYGTLQGGEPVTADNGRVVNPEEVLGLARPGRRIAYCLDTRPCAGGLALARGADLLVHEGTFTDDATEEAAAYAHSTARQAARIAAEAGSRQLLVTHLSSRYDEAGAARALTEARQVFAQTTLAEDFLACDLGPAPPG
ncbi:MAG TPA: ribonuclease Z [Dehalococcoidia bacterium]|nr:ribonuclease Z [Dehalococcoidia bacterium]